MTEDNRIGFPKVDHEHILAGLTDTPLSVDVINDAIDVIHEYLVQYGWPKNTMIHGFCYEAMWAVYVAGEKRGVARERCPATALFPIP